MSQRTHGGGVDRAMAELGVAREAIHDFSASINPFGVPPQVRRALRDAIERISDYPELDAGSLRCALAEFHGLPEECLLPGSGSTELIYLLPRVLRPRKALLIQPAFGEYAPALAQVGCQLEYFALLPEDGFHFSVSRLMEKVDAQTELVVLANPGNPSGVAIDPEQLLQLAVLLGGRRLLVDEAFIDFCPARSIIEMVPRLPNLLVLRSLTKFYAIPGLRAGYLAGGEADVAQLAAAREPWSLSNLAIAAAKASLEADDFRLQTLRSVPKLRDELRRGLEGLGLVVFPGAANYLLARLPDGAMRADRLAELLRRQGVLIRNCADFAPLDSRYFRVAVLGSEANRQLLGNLQVMLG